MGKVLKGNLLKYVITRIDFEDLYEIEKNKLKQIRDFCREQELTYELPRELDSQQDFELNDPITLRELPEEYVRTCVCNCYYNENIKIEINQFFIRIIQKVDKDKYTTYVECHLPFINEIFNILDIDKSLILRIGIKKIDETFFKSLDSMKQIFKPELVQSNLFGSEQRWEIPSSGSIAIQNFEYKQQKINFFRKIDRVVFRHRNENEVIDKPYYRIYLEYEVYKRDYNKDESIGDNLVDIDSVTMDLFLESFTQQGKDMIIRGKEIGDYGYNV